ncbi:MAG: hypothetical protein ABI203_10065 [Mucilaginibacter sp.]
MKFLLLLVLLFSFSVSYSQKGIEKLSKEKIDSLKNIQIDTIIWYHSYCGECFFKKTDAPIKYYTCQVESGYDLSYNAIIYQQVGKYFILNFDCNNLVIKRQLDTCKSMSYFISIISVLNARDKAIEQMRKKGQFSGPSQTDGGFEDVEISLNKNFQHVHIQDEIDYNTSKMAQQNFWNIKEIKLIRLISNDIKEKLKAH